MGLLPIVFGTMLPGFLQAAKLPVKAPEPQEHSSSWKWNFEEARKEAEKTGRDLLVDFSGSDWCGWCIRLANEVFHQEAFLKEATKHFVLVELDFPRKPQDPAIQKQNARLKVKYPIAGYPTVYLMDSKGRPYGRSGYQQGGPAPYLAMLEKFRKLRADRDRALARGAKLEGVERAKALDEAVQIVSSAGVGSFYLDEMRAIVRLDGDGKAGLASKYRKQIDRMAIEAAEGAGNLDEAMSLIEAYRTKHHPEAEEEQELLVKVGMIRYRKQDIPAAIESFGKAREASPSSPMAKQLSIWIEKLQGSTREER